MTTFRPRPSRDDVASPSFYAHPRWLRNQVLRDTWTILHPPYTLWHLSYVVLGGCLVGPVNATILLATLLAFFLAVGVGAHALDELQGRPLATKFNTTSLIIAAVVGVTGAAGLGVAGIFVVGPALVIFIVVGVVVVVGYNLELLGGRLHNDIMFSLSWGAFPLLTSYFAQHGNLSASSLVAGIFVFFLSSAQRQLSTPARQLRRRTRHVSGTMELVDGTSVPMEVSVLLGPLEQALRSLSWAVVALAVAMAMIRFHVG